MPKTGFKDFCCSNQTMISIQRLKISQHKKDFQLLIHIYCRLQNKSDAKINIMNLRGGRRQFVGRTGANRFDDENKREQYKRSACDRER